MKVVRRVCGLAVITGAAALVPATMAGATVSPTTGQPGTTQNFNCGTGNSAPTEPGHAASAGGSAFNETTPGTAGTVYAGNGVSKTQAGSTAAVSQYDTACRVLTFGAAGGLH